MLVEGSQKTYYNASCMTPNTIPRQKIGVTLPSIQIKRAKEKAKNELGFNLPELLRHLVANYLTNESIAQKREGLSDKTLKRLDKEMQEFYKNEYALTKRCSSAQELVKALEVDEE